VKRTFKNPQKETKETKGKQEQSNTLQLQIKLFLLSLSIITFFPDFLRFLRSLL